jgi:hypothetical protein
MCGVDAALHKIASSFRLQAVSSMVRLPGPQVFNELNTASIHDREVVALFAQHNQRCPTRVGLQSKRNSHNSISF